MSKQNIDNAQAGSNDTRATGSILAAIPPRVDRAVLRLDAAGVVDARKVSAAPGSLLVECARTPAGWHLRTLAAGSPERVNAHPAAADAKTLDLPEMVLLPPLVNAHTHLDLSHIGPRPFDRADGFQAWLGMIRSERRSRHSEIGASVLEGVRLSRDGGVLAVGDIAGGAGELSVASAAALASSGLAGVSFLEFFAIGRGEQAGLARLSQTWQTVRSIPPRSGWVCGVHPHAPYSVSTSAYHAAVEMTHQQRPAHVCTHIAESLGERELVMHATGPLRAFLEQVGVWDDGLNAEFGKGLSPVAHLGEQLLSRIGLLVHANDLSDADIELLGRASRSRNNTSGQPLSVVFCPRAAAYFGHDQDLGPHRWRELAQVGVNVAVGTDSIVNLDTPDRISPLDDLRLLQRTSRGTTFAEGLAMVTCQAAVAMGLNPEVWAFGEGQQVAGVVGVAVDVSRDPLKQVLQGTGALQLLCAGIFSG